MRIGFPYFPIIKYPRDILAYLVIRALCSPRLMSIPGLHRLIRRSAPFLKVKPKPLDGLEIYLSTVDSSQMAIFNEIFIEKVYDLEALPFEPLHVIDCGAHVGMFSVLAFSNYTEARYTLFEPNTENLEVLKLTIEANKLPFDLIESAVSDFEGSKSFYAESSYEGQLISANTNVQSYSVRCVKLADYIKNNCDERLLLKIDIEGHEEIVLPDIIPSLPRNTAIFFETHSGDDSWNSLSNCLQENGFKVVQTRWRDPYADGFAYRLE